MSRYCERCGAKFEEGAVHYLVTVHATPEMDEKLPSAGTLEDLEAVMRLIDAKNRKETDPDVYQSKAFSLCGGCKKLFMKNPLNMPLPPLKGEDEGEGRVH